MLTPQEVASHSFARATLGGYNMSMVDEFLDLLTEDYTALYNDNAILKNKLKEIRTEKGLSQSALAEMVGVSRNTISSIETGQFSPTAKLALIICIALDKKFEDVFYF